MSRGFGATKSNSRNAEPSSELQVLGRSIRVRGRVTGEGSIRLEGEVEGDVNVTGQFDVGGTGTLVGNLSAGHVTVEGVLQGSVESSGPVHIRAGARVVGDISTTEFSLEEGASYRGRIDAAFELPDGLSGSPKEAKPAARRR
jgi:cytoskeletal protein CcmA (bactofilin family)